MSEFELIRIVDARDARPCEALSREYMEWLVERLRTLHGIALDDVEVETIHRDMRAEAPALLGDPGRLYLGRVSGEPVALGVLKPVSPTVGEVKRMYVRPGWRSRGLGRVVFDRLLEDGRHLGYQRLQLETFPFMEAAVGMYRRHGFEVTAPFAGYEGEAHGVGGVEMFMALNLGSRQR